MRHIVSLIGLRTRSPNSKTDLCDGSARRPCKARGRQRMFQRSIAGELHDGVPGMGQMLIFTVETAALPMWCL